MLKIVKKDSETESKNGKILAFDKVYNFAANSKSLFNYNYILSINGTAAECWSIVFKSSTQ